MLTGSLQTLPSHAPSVQAVQSVRKVGLPDEQWKNCSWEPEHDCKESMGHVRHEAYVHWYVRHGMEEEKFIDSFASLEQVLDNYKQI